MPAFKVTTGTTAIKDIIYAEVEKKLSVQAVSAKYKQFISKFIQKREKQLYANIPSHQTYYSVEDINEWYQFTNIDQKLVKDALKKTYYGKIPNFKPLCAKDDSTIALLCAVRYYFLNKKDIELKLALFNLCFSGKLYPSIFYKAFRYEPAEHVMEYVLNHMMTNKFNIIKYGNVMATITATGETWLDTYKDRFKDFSDEDAVYMLQQLYNRIDGLIHNISSLYYEAYKNKDLFITYDVDDVSTDNFRLADNDSFKITRIVENAIREITTKGIDFVNCKIASNDMVKFDELKGIIDALVANRENLALLDEYITLMVSLYFQENKNESIKDIAFISYSIKPTPNSKNKYVNKKKEILDKILINNSPNFARRRSRAATESAYYKCINAYLALMIQKANK